MSLHGHSINLSMPLSPKAFLFLISGSTESLEGLLASQELHTIVWHHLVFSIESLHV